MSAQPLNFIMKQASGQFENKTICVLRECNGKTIVLKIENQHHFKEWTGCFSLINSTQRVRS